MMTKKILYGRISSIDQNIDRQTVEANNFDEVYIDKVSGSVPFAERAESSKLIQLANDGASFEIYVHEIDRLGRNLLDILKTIEFFSLKGICIHCDKQGIRTLDKDGEENTTAKLLISVLGCVAEMELNQKKERQREGIKAAKVKGVYKGRKKGATVTADKFYKQYKPLIKELKNDTKLSCAKLAKLHDVSPQTVLNVKKRLIKMGDLKTYTVASKNN